tara:strand:- start:2410 stop:2691 length:282 start_codon:yes stop_codon:yes gene_type:complete
MDKNKLENYLLDNCKRNQSIENRNVTNHRILLPLNKPENDTKYQSRFHHLEEKEKSYHWKSGGANIYSFSHCVKRILKDLEKGVIKIKERANG